MGFARIAQKSAITSTKENIPWRYFEKSNKREKVQTGINRYFRDATEPVHNSF